MTREADTFKYIFFPKKDQIYINNTQQQSSYQRKQQQKNEKQNDATTKFTTNRNTIS